MSKYVLHTDVVFSRRKTLHHLVNAEQEPVWSGKLISAAFQQLADLGVYEFRLEGQDPNHGFQVMIHAD